MEISYDKEADAMYIEFRKGSSVKNKKIDDSTIVDLDDKGKMIGIEILNVSKRINVEPVYTVKVNKACVSKGDKN